MLRRRYLLETVAIGVVVSGCIGLSTPMLAQSTASPAAGSVILPAPEPQFGGIIGRKASESKPDFPRAVTAPKGAPNVLLIMTDDTGFGASRRRTWSESTRTGFATTNSTPPRCVHRRVLHSSPAVTITASASAIFRNSPPAIRATIPSFRKALALSATFSSATVTTRHGSASTT
jgi:hypothetical protein